MSRYVTSSLIVSRRTIMYSEGGSVLRHEPSYMIAGGLASAIICLSPGWFEATEQSRAIMHAPSPRSISATVRRELSQERMEEAMQQYVFNLHAQPILDLSTNTVTRLRGPLGGPRSGPLGDVTMGLDGSGRTHRSKDTNHGSDSVRDATTSADQAARVLDRTSDGVPDQWLFLLRDWERSLLAANYPATTRYNYLLAAAQLARYLSTVTDDGFSDAAADPAAVQRLHIEDFQAWMIQTRSASTALNKHKALRQFFAWLVSEEEIDRTPMDRVRQPKTPQRLIPIMRAEERRSGSWTPAGRRRSSPRSATRRSCACWPTLVPACRRSPICCSSTSTWTATW
jgi:Phage integrase, N-terminal SAM-like domain